MSAQTISLRLPPDESEMLSMLAHHLGISKSDIIRNALKPVFDEAFNKPETIVLSNRDFQIFLDELSSEPSEEILKCRRLLQSYELWD